MQGYQFWVQTDSNGNFAIKNVISGVYGLHGWVPGFMGDYLNKEQITISEGTNCELQMTRHKHNKQAPQ